MTRARVALVHPSPSSISTMRRIVQSTLEYELVFDAEDVPTAAARLVTRPVDLVLLALEAASADAGAGLRALLATGASVLVVASDHARDYAKVYGTLERGAIDVVDLPSVDERGLPVGVDAFRAKLLSVRRLLAPKPPTTAEATPVPVVRPSAHPLPRTGLLAIGASTGGPNAIARVLSDLPKPIDYAIVVIQHVDPAFSETVASWIARASGVPVTPAQTGQHPTPGLALIASTHDHLVMLPGGALRYTSEPKENPYRPSVDVFLESVAACHRERAVAVLLTGMGRDGARGMKAMREAGFTTIAQDEKTSVVWGMPRAAIEAGAAEEVLALERIGPVAASALGRRRAR